MTKKTDQTKEKPEPKPRKKAKPPLKGVVGKYARIDEEKPLTAKEKIFVSEYLKSRNGADAIRKAGFSEKRARNMASHLINLKPNTKKAIADGLGRIFDHLEVDALGVIQRISHIAMTDMDRLIPIRGGRVIIQDTDTLPVEVKALYAGAEERITEAGDITVKVNTNDQLKALELLCKYFGILEKARQARQAPLIEQQNAIKSFMKGEKTIVEVALELELQGVPLPESIRILLSKHSEPEEVEDDGNMVIPTPEEMDARRQKRLKEIEDQKSGFLPERQQEVRDLKAEMGKKNQAFAEGADGDITEK